MRQAGKITAGARTIARQAVAAGVTTKQIDKCVHEFIVKSGAKPTFKGYGGFPGSACISVNDEIIHGIPGKRVIREGDIVSLDVGAIAKGWAAQRVAEASPKGMLISVGGNVCATGPKDANGTPWVIGIQNPNGGEYALDLLMIAKYFERIGDHCTNIAEWVVFSVTGEHKECQ